MSEVFPPPTGKDYIVTVKVKNGPMYNVTREKIRQIEHKALKKLSHPAMLGRKGREMLE